MNILRHYWTLSKFAAHGNKGFYESREYMAEVLIDELENYLDLKNKKIVDVGGERGDFCKILSEKRNCQAINVEPIKPENGYVWKTIEASADNLPFKDKSIDLVLFRGVIQHIPTSKKLKSLKEVHRVLKDGGLAYVMIPPWYNPLSGQNIKPFQYLPFPIAKHFSTTIMGRKIKANSLEELGIWPMTISSTRKLIKKGGFKILKSIDIIGRIHFITKIPVLREFLLSSVGFIVKK